MERTKQDAMREAAETEREVSRLENRRLGLLTETEHLGDLDRVGMIREAKKLAADLVKKVGKDGDASARFMRDADARFASQLGAGEIHRIWAEATGQKVKRPVKA